jgi:hypothetical protein
MKLYNFNTINKIKGNIYEIIEIFNNVNKLNNLKVSIMAFHFFNIYFEYFTQEKFH